MNTVASGRSSRLRWTALGAAVACGAVALALFDASEAEIDAVAPPTFSVPSTGERSFADVIEQVSPAVVTIAVAKVIRPTPTGNLRGGRTPFDDFFERFFDAPGVPGGAQPQPRRAEGQGSGFIIDSDGYVATNYHVVDGAEKITVTLQSGQALAAEVVGADPQTDIALLRVDSGRIDGLTAVGFGDSDRTRVGDWVLAIGNPFGLGGTATAGIVSARGRDIASGPYDDYLQIDAPINFGNSGGPVFNAAGQVIGINTAIFSPNGGNVGIGFAIPSNQARHVLDELRSAGTISRGWLGVQIQPVDADLAGALDLPAAGGALIAAIEPNSPASRSSLEAGDVVVRAGGVSVDSPRDLARIVGMSDAGKTLELEVLREGRSRTISVALGSRAAGASQAANAGRRTGSNDVPRAAAAYGLQLRDLDAALRHELRLGADVEGAIVADVRAGSEAAAQGIRAGDVIVSVDRRRTASAEEASAALADAQDAGGRALVLVRRGDSQRFVALGTA